MRKLVIVCILLSLLAGARLAIYRSPQYRQQIANLLYRSKCDTPISYKVGSIDPKFKLSQDQVLEDLKESADIWEEAAGRPLFSPAPEGDITINFVYDERAALDTELTEQQGQLNKSSTTLDQQIKNYEGDAKTFELKLANFNTRVKQYNSEGGAPPDIYEKLIAEQAQLQKEAEALNARASQLNISARKYNSNVGIFNRNVDKFNSAIAQKPEEGIFDLANSSITIYFASNRKELIHTLAHELGHAIGLDHASDSAAIMYPFTTESLTVSADEGQQLQIVCRDRPVPAYWMEDFRGLVRKYIPAEILRIL